MSNSIKDYIHVGFDCDGVLRKLRAQAINSFLEKHPEHHQLFHEPEDVNDWDFRTSFKHFDQEVYDMLMDYVFGNPKTSYKVFRNAPIYPEARDFSRFYNVLSKSGFKVSICTTQNTAWQQIATTQWLHENQIQFDNLIMAGENSKHIFGLDWLIDDHWKNVADVDRSGNKGVLMVQQWNKKDKRRVKRQVNTIEQYVNMILNEEL